MVKRLFNIPKSNSFFLFGARGTGKTHLLREVFNKESVLMIDLLDDEVLWHFSKNPSSLISEYQHQKRTKNVRWVVIDEVQRLPELLNVAHQMLETPSKVKPLFALTGSSSRKLKKGAANLLGGRAFVFGLFPFTHVELGEQFDLMKALTFGTLPRIFELNTDIDRIRFLRSYIATYVKEEVVSEQIIRKIVPFRDFLAVSAQMSSKVLNIAKIAKEVGIDSKTVDTYFSILEETYMGFRLPAFHESVRKAQRRQPKFYWFDLGVRRTLNDTVEFLPAPGTSYYGELFEEYVINEIYRLNTYSEKNYLLSYFATQNSRTEVDVILDKARGRIRIGVEIKSSNVIDETEVRSLSVVGKDIKATHLYYLSQCQHNAMIEGVRCMDWRQGLKEIFGF